MTESTRESGVYHEIQRMARFARRTARRLRTDLSEARCFLLFVGNPRSGTTLVRSLLNAHPAVILANEVHAAWRMSAGESWNTVLSRIIDSEQQFSVDPVWTGYRYQVPQAAQTHCAGKVQVIGDKKAGATSKLLSDKPNVLLDFCRWSPLPVRLIHCVRNPFDVITTKTRRNGLPLEVNIKRYFHAERVAAMAVQSPSIHGSFRIFQEELIRRPKQTMQELLRFIDLDAPDGFLGACESVIYEKPNLSRFGLPWTEASKWEVERRTREIEHLQEYLDGDQLPFYGENTTTDSSSMGAAA